MALPPEHQRTREFVAILESEKVLARLGRRPIDAVERVAPDLYRVKAGECSVEVRIVGDPAPEGSGEDWAGPCPFHVEAGEAVCE